MTERRATNVTWHHGEVSPEARAEALGHAPACLWLTGLSGSGKSTLANRLERRLIERGAFAYVLDGDNVRHGLNADLGFGPEDRAENIRRIAEVARLFVDAGAIVITAFISPFRADRAAAREKLGERFVEVHVSTPLEECEARDPKGLYARARQGEIGDFTGISSPYEAPEAAEITIDNRDLVIDECADRVMAWLVDHGVLPPIT